MKPFFSIIIPAYNAGETIIKCLESVYQQKFVNYEVIIINDGSSDNTEELIKEAIKDKNAFRLINTKNQGVSYARNLGISVCSGAYIVFLDSDDWVLQGYLEYAYEKLKLNNYDGIIFNYLEVTGTTEKHMDNGLSGRNSPSFDYEKLFLLCVIQNNPWDKIFKREFFIDHGIEFSTGISVGEDALLTFEILLRSRNIFFSEKAFVMYKIDSQGVSKTKITDKKIRDILYIADSIKSKVSKSKLNYFHYYNVRLLYHYYMFSNRNELNYIDALKVEFFKSIKLVSLNNVPTIKLKFLFLLLKIAVLLKVLPLLKFIINKF